MIASTMSSGLAARPSGMRPRTSGGSAGWPVLVVRHQTHGDGIDANPVRTARQCQRAHQRQQASLTRAVASGTRARVPAREHGGEKDDCRVTPGHQRHHVLAAQHGAVDQVAERRVLALLASATRAIGTRKPAHGVNERPWRHPVIAQALLERLPCCGLLERAVESDLRGVVRHGAWRIDRDDPPSFVAQAGHQRIADEAVAPADNRDRGVRFSMGLTGATVPVSPRWSKTCRSMTVCSIAIAEKKTKRTGPARATAAMARTRTVTSRERLESG